jgi:bacterioferritin-associated ferredoxin
MYVCVCKAVCDKRVREAIEAGAQTVGAVGRACGAGTDCGSCQDAIACLIDEHVDDRAEATRPAGRVALPMRAAG